MYGVTSLSVVFSMPKKFSASEARRSPLNMKTTEDLRRRLEEAAATSGRALTHEVEHRMERSFLEDEMRAYRELKDGDEETRELGETIKLALGMLNKHAGTNWKQSYSARMAAQKAVLQVLELWFERFPLEEPSADDRAAAKSSEATASFVARTCVGLAARDPMMAQFIEMWGLALQSPRSNGPAKKNFARK